MLAKQMDEGVLLHTDSMNGGRRTYSLTQPGYLNAQLFFQLSLMRT